MKLRIGFIGCGSISYRHLNVFKEREDVDVTSIFDPNEKNVKSFVSAYGKNLKIYKSDEELIEKEKLDGVVICSPHTFHFKQIKNSLEKGIDVLVEKPAVVEYKEAVEIRKMIEERNKKVVVAYQRHYLADVNGAKKIISEGKIGKVFFISGFLAQKWYELFSTGKDKRTWRLLPEFAGKGQLTDSGSHFVAMLFYLTGLNPLEVYAHIDFKDVKVDINSNFIVKFKEGANASIGILGEDPSWRECMMIWGEDGVIKISLSENSYIHYKGKEKPEEIPSDYDGPSSPADDFIRCLKEGKEPQTDWHIIENTALLSDKVYESYFEGKPVKIL